MGTNSHLTPTHLPVWTDQKKFVPLPMLKSVTTQDPKG